MSPKQSQQICRHCHSPNLVHRDGWNNVTPANNPVPQQWIISLWALGTIFGSGLLHLSGRCTQVLLDVEHLRTRLCQHCTRPYTPEIPQLNKEYPRVHILPLDSDLSLDTMKTLSHFHPLQPGQNTTEIPSEESCGYVVLAAHYCRHGPLLVHQQVQHPHRQFSTGTFQGVEPCDLASW